MEYIVQKGDTLTKIASKFNTSIDAIQKCNSSITNVNKITIGQKIFIPTNSKGYSELLTTLKKCISDIESLASFKELEKML